MFWQWSLVLFKGAHLAISITLQIWFNIYHWLLHCLCICLWFMYLYAIILWYNFYSPICFWKLFSFLELVVMGGGIFFWFSNVLQQVWNCNAYLFRICSSVFTSYIIMLVYLKICSGFLSYWVPCTLWKIEEKIFSCHHERIRNSVSH